MLGMHPIFTLFGTAPDLSTPAGAASYTRQLAQQAGLHVMLTQPGSKIPWDTRTDKDREADDAQWQQLRRDNPDRNLPEKMGGFYLASNNPTRLNKLIKSGYKIIEAELAERDFLRDRRDMAQWRREGTGEAEASLAEDRIAELAELRAQALADVDELTTDEGKPPRKGTKKYQKFVHATKLSEGEDLTGDEQRRLSAIENTYPEDHPWPNFAVEVGSSNAVVVDCDTADEVAWFKEWATQQSGDAKWMKTMPTVLSPGVFADGEWKHRDGGHYWFTIDEAAGLTTADGVPVKPLPEEITKVTVKKPGTNVQFTIMVNRAYVLIPPSHRAEGSYRAAGPSHSLPGWLYSYILTDHIDRREKVARKREEKAQREGLGPEEVEQLEHWWETRTWGSILSQLGWTRYGKADSCGCPVFSRPGGSSPKSATAHVRGCSDARYADSMDPPIHFWTDSPGPEISAMIDAAGTSGTLSKLQLVAAVEEAGDVAKATRDAIELPAGGSSYEYEVTDLGGGLGMVNSVATERDMDQVSESAYLSHAQAPLPDTPAPVADGGQQEDTPITGSSPFVGDDTTYEASEEEEEELPPVELPAKKEEIPVYKTSNIEHDPIRLSSLEELRRGRPPVRFLIREWLQENSISLVVGQSNAGKSAVVLDMLCAMAADQRKGESDFTQWMGVPTKRRNILYVAGEGIDGVTNRVSAWEKHHGRSVAGHMVFKEEAFKFLSPESSWYTLGESIKANNIDVVVFDTLAMMMTGMEENSNDDMGQAVSWLQNLQRHTGASIILVHHTTKSADNPTPRGASALTGAVASQVLVQKRDMETLDEDMRERFEQEGTTPIRVSVTKQKDGRYPPALDLTLVEAPVPPRLDKDGNLMPDIDDFGVPNNTRTVLVGDTTGVIPRNLPPVTEYEQKKESHPVPPEFHCRVLEKVVERIITLTTGPSRSRRVQESTRTRLLDDLRLNMECYVYGASKEDLKRAFESALDVAFHRGIVEYEGSRIVPNHTLRDSQGQGIDRTDRDAVRAAMMEPISDKLVAENYISEESEDTAEAEAEPQTVVPDTLPDGQAVSATQVSGLALDVPDGNEPVLPPGESRSRSIPAQPVRILSTPYDHSQQQQPQPQPRATGGLSLTVPEPDPQPVVPQQPQQQPVMGGLSLTVPDQPPQPPQPQPQQPQTGTNLPPVPGAVPGAVPKPVPPKIPAQIPQQVTPSVTPQVTNNDPWGPPDTTPPGWDHLG